MDTSEEVMIIINSVGLSRKKELIYWHLNCPIYKNHAHDANDDDDARGCNKAKVAKLKSGHLRETSSRGGTVVEMVRGSLKYFMGVKISGNKIVIRQIFPLVGGGSIGMWIIANKICNGTKWGLI